MQQQQHANPSQYSAASGHSTTRAVQPARHKHGAMTVQTVQCKRDTSCTAYLHEGGVSLVVRMQHAPHTVSRLATIGTCRKQAPRHASTRHLPNRYLHVPSRPHTPRHYALYQRPVHFSHTVLPDAGTCDVTGWHWAAGRGCTVGGVLGLGWLQVPLWLLLFLLFLLEFRMLMGVAGGCWGL